MTLNPFVDIPVTITYGWRGPDGSPIMQGNNVVTINPLTLENAGIYTCTVTVSSTTMFVAGPGSSNSTISIALCKS
jgi:hypothetical protein